MNGSKSEAGLAVHPLHPRASFRAPAQAPSLDDGAWVDFREGRGDPASTEATRAVLKSAAVQWMVLLALCLVGLGLMG